MEYLDSLLDQHEIIMYTSAASEGALVGHDQTVQMWGQMVYHLLGCQLGKAVDKTDGTIVLSFQGFQFLGN